MEQLSPFQRRPWQILVILSAVFLFIAWLVYTPPGIFGKADAVGYAVCHRISVRSFFLGERQFPLCARCTGMYLGAVVGMVYQSFTARRRYGMPPLRVIAGLVLLLAAFGVDGLNSYGQLFQGMPKLYEPQNWLRLLTGTGMGVAVITLLYPAFQGTAWKDADPRPAMPGLRRLVAVLALGGLADLLVLSGSPLALYPLALISAAGVLLLLVMVYSMVWMMTFRLENHFLHFSELKLPLAGGFLISIAQIAFLDFVRFWLTGTWEGFHIG
jgi:uncharacterized membrane protein